MPLLYDPLCRGVEHAAFNAALLETARLAFASEPLVFCAEAAHIAEVKLVLGEDRSQAVTWHPLAVAPRAGEPFAGRVAAEMRVCGDVFGEARRLGLRRLVACSISDAGLIALKSRVWTNADVTVAVVHHAGLARTLGSRSTRWALRVGNGRRLRHIVLGDDIRAAAIERDPSLDDVLGTLPHPWLFSPDTDNGRETFDRPLVFGFVGLASEHKGFPAFCELARYIKTEVDPGVRFTLAGFLPEGTSKASSDMSGIEAPSPDVLSRAAYGRMMSELTYTVFPFDPRSYSLISSGSIMDAFAFVKPCIACSNRQFDTYFQSMGDIGYRCSDASELRQVVTDIVRNPSIDRYRRQCETIVRARDMFTPPRLAGALAGILG